MFLASLRLLRYDPRFGIGFISMISYSLMFYCAAWVVRQLFFFPLGLILKQFRIFTLDGGIVIVQGAVLGCALKKRTLKQRLFTQYLRNAINSSRLLFLISTLATSKSYTGRDF
jgi:hypothetical protein